MTTQSPFDFGTVKKSMSRRAMMEVSGKVDSCSRLGW